MIPIYDNNPSQTKPVVTKALIYLNVFFFLVSFWLEARGVSWISAGYGMVPSRLSADPAGEWGKIFTSMFLHGGLAHLGWNLLFLHIFGDNVEDTLGKKRFLAFYFLSGWGAALAQFAIDPQSTIPMIGASGAIAGVLGGYLLLYPRAPVAVINPILPLWLLMGPFFALPAWFVVGEWFVGNLLGGLASLNQTGGGVAFFAHLGGFVTGLLLIRPMVRGRNPEARDRWSGFRTPVRTHRGPRIFWKESNRPFWKD